MLISPYTMLDERDTQDTLMDPAYVNSRSAGPVHQATRSGLPRHSRVRRKDQV